LSAPAAAHWRTIPTSIVDYAVEHAQIAARQALAKAICGFDTQIAIRQKIRGQPGLDEASKLFELQTLKADRGLELPELKHQLRLEAWVGPGILQHGLRSRPGYP
jgi:hypothetical protein